MSYIGESNPDNKTLFTGTITTTGVGNTLDMTGYDTALIQVANSTFSGIITLECSLDSITWYSCLVSEMNSMNQKSQIDSLGLYAVRTEAQYLRYNVTNISGSVDLIIDGGHASIFNVDKLAWAMDENNNSPLNIKLQPQNSGIKQDLSGAFILSDAPQSVIITTGANNTTNIIDTQGYRTIHLTTGSTFAATGGIQFSTDGITFTQSSMMTAAGAYVTTFIASTNYVIPISGRFARIVATTFGSYTYVLRNIPPQQVGQNLIAVGGSTVVTGGLAGTLGVGGSTAVGVAPTSNPVIAGAIDPGGLGRRLFSDATGRLILNPFSLGVQVPSSLAGITQTTTTGGNLSPVVNSGYNNQVALSVQDTSQFESQSSIELLAQILQEMKIMNHQLYELPRILSGQLNGIKTAGNMPVSTYGDEPARMRNDVSLFDKQQ